MYVMINNKMKKILILSVVLIASGCSLFSDKNADTAENWSAERLYFEAKGAMDSGNYKQAIEHYQKLQARFPFGKFSKQAQLDMAYSYYKQGETAASVAAADRFIKLYPTQPSADYAYYIKGLALFNQGKGFVDRYIPRDDYQRDPGASLG